MLTAREAVPDRVRGLDRRGGRTTSPSRLTSRAPGRVRALIRRGPAPGARVLTAGDLVLDPAGRTVRRGADDGQPDGQEFAILEYSCATRAGPVRPGSSARVGLHRNGDSNIVDVYVRILRDKIDRRSAGGPIETVRGVLGYRLLP